LDKKSKKRLRGGYKEKLAFLDLAKICRTVFGKAVGVILIYQKGKIQIPTIALPS